MLINTHFQNTDFPASRWHSRGQRFDPAYLHQKAWKKTCFRNETGLFLCPETDRRPKIERDTALHDHLLQKHTDGVRYGDAELIQNGLRLFLSYRPDVQTELTLIGNGFAAILKDIKKKSCGKMAESREELLTKTVPLSRKYTMPF